MSEGRRYTLDEIDGMRSALEAISIHNLCPGGHGSWSGDYEKSRIESIERSLRTYLAAGVDPEEIRAKAHAVCDRK